MTVALGPQLSAEVFRHMAQEEIDELVLEIAALDKVSPEEKLQVMEEFYESSVAQEFIAQGGIGFAKDVLERALGDQKAVEIMGRLSTYIRVSPFEFLRKIDPMQIYNFLQHEHPQTIALIMAYLPADSAATVLGMMPQEQQSEVAMRIALMDRTAPEVVREVEQVMERKLSSLINQDLAAAGGVKPLVDILNFVDRATEGNILQTFDERDAELADEVRKLMFVFEDLMLLDDKAIQQLLKEVEMKDVGARPQGLERGRQGEDLRQHVDARGPDAPGGHGVHGPGQAPRHRGGPGPHRGDRAPPGGDRQDRDLRAAPAPTTSSWSSAGSERRRGRQADHRARAPRGHATPHARARRPRRGRRRARWPAAARSPSGKPTGLTAFLEMAQRQGAELVASARAQADGIADDARREGYRGGLRRGQGAGRARGARPAAVRGERRARGRRGPLAADRRVRGGARAPGRRRRRAKIVKADARS